MEASERIASTQRDPPPPQGRAAWSGTVAACGAAFLVLAVAPAVAEAPVLAELEGGARVRLAADQQLVVEALPDRGEGLIAFARRWCGSGDPAGELGRLNGTRRLLAGRRYRVPFGCLAPPHAAAVMGALFPDDRRDRTGWHHRVGAPRPGDEGESLWRLAAWFIGRGEAFAELREANALADDQLVPGQELWIPAALLRPALRAALPPEGVPLEYRSEDGRALAVYRLQPGEALYSSVVMRFTGEVYGDAVNAAAEEIAALSGIRDVTDIPIGYEVKLPLERLLPQFLPADDPRRQEYEAGLIASAAFRNTVEARTLEGITVILDPGHGGRDVGAARGRVWESIYVDDIALRVKRLLEEGTAARVVTTTRDGDGFRIVDRDVLPVSRGHRVLTTPPYAIEDSRIGVNLRWYLANSIFRKAVEGGTSRQQLVFLSLHADSLHPSLRGAMVYYPSARFPATRNHGSRSIYSARAEVREQPQVRLSLRQRRESEGLSRQLAREVIAAMAAAQMAVHPYQPVRGRIARNRREYVPAVIRYNEVPTKILVEVCNLANGEDRALLQTRRFRQQVAEAVVAGLLRYYRQDGEGSAGVRVAAGR